MADEHRISRDDAGQRLDRYLRKLLPGATLAHVYKLIRKGRVRVNEARAQPGTRLVEGDAIRLSVPEELARSAAAATGSTAAPLVVLYEDDDILVADKPEGLALHAGSGIGGDHLAARIAAYLGEPSARTFRPAAAHRLDRGTSGAVLIGKTGRGLRGLTEALREGRVDKQYDAVVCGPLPTNHGRITAPLDGKPAETSWQRVVRVGDHALLRVRIATGRRHQVRVHLAGIGAAVVGDRRYGGRPARRLLLHAAELTLRHPVTGTDLRVASPLPDDFVAELRRLGLRSPPRKEHA